jgi:hypothetical protein
MSDQRIIQIDDDWKQEAQREKERLAAKQAAAAPAASASGSAAARGSRGASSGGASGGASGGRRREMPPASFETLVSTLASQALMYLGAVADPRTGQAMVSTEVARHNIDLLSVLEDKTQQNLTDDERSMLGSTLYELRMRYVDVAHAMRENARGAGGM